MERSVLTTTGSIVASDMAIIVGSLVNSAANKVTFEVKQLQ